MKIRIILLLFLLGTIMTHTIIFDEHNPFIIQNSKFNSTLTIINLIMNMKFPIASSGLHYKQYFALKFPHLTRGISGNEILSTALLTNFTCSLTNKETNTSIIMSYVKTSYFQGSNDTIFCLLNDTSTEVPLKSNINYQFTVSMLSKNIELSTSFMDSFNLFTLTNNNDLALIIDTAFGFGSGIKTSESTYNNPVSLTAIARVDNNLADITSSSPIYQYNTVNLRLQFVVNTLFRFENAAIKINYPDTNLVSKMADKVGSFDVIAGDITKKKLEVIGNFPILNQYDINSQLLTGFNEVWLNRGREFYIVLYNINIADGDISTQQLKTGIMFKNSNLVQSISSQNFPTVLKNTFGFSIEHPEGWDIYMSGAWPLLFKYGVSSSSLFSASGFYVTIRYSNLIPAFEVFNFVASTCDFSLNDLNDNQFSKAFGVRNNCFPIQPTDLNVFAYFNTSNNNLSFGRLGSGIFFKQNNFKINTIYSVLVWGVADVCGKPNFGVTTDAANLADPLTSSTALTTAVNFKFDFAVYNLIDQTKENSDRFNTNNSIGSFLNKVSLFKCYSVFRGYILNLSTAEGLGFEYYEPASDTNPSVYPYRNAGVSVPSTTPALTIASQPASAKYDNLLYKEFSDPVIMDAGGISFNGIPTSSSDYGYNVAGNGNLSAVNYSLAGYGAANNGNQAFQPLFLYSDTSSNKVIGVNKAILIRGDFFIYNYSSPALRDSKSGIPSPVFANTITNVADNVNGLWAQQQGVLEVLFSSNYFDKGLDVSTCALSWQIGNVVENVATKIQSPGYITAASSGYLKSFFPLNADGVTFSGWPTDPSNLAIMSTISQNLKNNFIKGQTINSIASNLSPPKIRIRSIMNSAGNNHPGGQYFTVNHATLGYIPYSSSPSTTASQNPALTCSNSFIGCNLVFNLYTNCLKWADTYPTNKILYNYIDVIYRFLPALVGTLINNGPNRVIRFIKLFPEAQGFQDVQKRTTFISGGTTIGFQPISIHYTFIGEDSLRNGTTNVGMGTSCLVQISNKAVDNLITYTNSKANTLALFLFNIPLLDVDVTDSSSTYPIGSLSQGVAAYGLNSAPTFARYGHMGSINSGTSDTESYGQNTAGLTKLALPLTYTNSGLSTSIHHSIYGVYSQSRTSYQYLLGSVILITNITPGVNPIQNSKVSNVNGNQDIFIPTRCPTGSPTTTYKTPSYFTFPTVYLTSMNASDYGNFTNVEKILKYKDSLSETEYSIMKPSSKTSDQGNYSSKKLAYTQFSNFGTARKDGISISFYHKDAAVVNCSGFNFFFSDKIKLDISTDRISFDIQENTTASNYMSFYTSNKYFYFNGQKFNQAASLGTSDTSIAPRTSSSASSTNTKYVYIYTKSLTSYLDSSVNGFYPDNLVAVGCASSGNTVSALSNLQIFSTTVNYFNNSIENYIDSLTSTGFVGLDIVTNPSDPSTFSTFSMSLDSGKNYLDDHAGNIKFSVKLTTTIPALTNINIVYSSSQTLFTDMVCGIINNNNYVEECNYSTTVPPAFVCKNKYATNFISICCYNVDVSTTFSITNLDFSQSQNYIKNTFFSGDIAIGTATLPVVSNTFYSISYQAGTSTPTFSNNNTVDVKTLFVKTFDIISYSVMQENAIGKLTLSFTLPRQPVRNSKIIIEGDFSMFINQTSGVKKDQSRCVASFSNSSFGKFWEKGDSLIEYCDISNIDTLKKITISIKSIIWKSSLIMNTSLYVNFTPVILGKIPAGNQYKISMILPSNRDTIEPISFTNTDKQNFFTSLKSAPKVPFKIDNLCPYSISPIIPNSLSDIEFEFDLLTNKTELDSYNLDIKEFTVALPFSYFGDYANSDILSQNCFINNNSLKDSIPCSFSSEGILNIDVTKFSQSLKGQKIKVGIENILIGDLPPASYSIICSVNSIDLSKERTNLLNGSGKNLNTLTSILNFANMYNIHFFPEEKSSSGASSGFYTSSNNTETLTNITLRFGIDFSLEASISNDILVDKDPIVHVYFPIGYKFSNNTFATMEQFKSVNNSLPLSSEIIPIKYVNITTSTSRRVSVSLNSSLIISSTHKYFDLKIANVINPLQIGMTGRFNIAITNSNYSWLIKSYTSAHDQATDNKLTEIGSKIIINNILDVFQFYRGFLIVKKVIQYWIVTLNGTNEISLNLGRYSQFEYIALSDTTRNSIFTRIINEDIKIKFPTGKVYVIDSYYRKVTISLGISCSESFASNFILNIKGSNSEFVFEPIKVTINSSTKGVIKFEPESSYTIKGGMILIYYSLDSADTNYDIISAKWNPAPTNDASSSLTMDDIPPNSTQGKGVFKITNDQIATTQTFNINLNNNCFNIDISQAKFELKGSAVELTYQTGIENWFTYNKPDQDSNLYQRKNSLHWTIIPTIVPIRIFCAIGCTTTEIPNFIELRAQNFTIGPFLQTFSAYLYNQTAKEVFFDGLLRGQNYELTCLIESPLAVPDSSKAYGYTKKTTNDGLSISPQKTEITKCARITFLNPVSENTKSILVSYCRGIFSPIAKNPIKEGCVECFNENGRNVFGVTWKGLQCPIFNSRLRFLQDIKFNRNLRNLQTIINNPISLLNTTNSPNSSNTTNTTNNDGVSTSQFTSILTSVKNLNKFTVCALQSKFCPTNTFNGIAYIMQNEFINVLLNKKRAIFDFESTLSYLNNTITSIEMIDETTSPNVSFNLVKASYLLPSNVSVNLMLNSENDYDWNCYFKVDLSSKDITADQIKYCTSFDSCGSQNVFGSKNVPSSYNITAKYLPFFVVKESYSVFVVCYHNIIGATVSSNVNVAFKFTVECSNNYKLVNDECVKDDTYVNGTIIDIQNNTSTNSNNTNSNFTSTNYLQRMNLYLGLILLFILLT